MSAVNVATSTSADQVGPASVSNFTNNGQFNVAAGQALAWGDGTNGSAGRLIVNGTANVRDFVSDGQITVAGGAAYWTTRHPRAASCWGAAAGRRSTRAA